MSRKNQPPWTPSPEYAALLPEISGCNFNGWGETEPHRPRQIFWLRKTDGHPFGRLLDAVAVLHRFRDTYDLSLKRDDTGFDIVRLLLAAGQRDEAAAMVTELRETFPDSRFTRRAQALLTGEGPP